MIFSQQLDYKTNNKGRAQNESSQVQNNSYRRQESDIGKELSVNRPDLDKTVRSPDNVNTFAREFLRLHEQSEEYLYMICMNVKNVITSVFEISHGNVNSSVVGIREIFQKALIANAVSIIVIRNHPSVNSQPSAEDINVTKRMVEAGKIIGVEVLDHLIIGDDEYTSLKEKGYL